MKTLNAFGSESLVRRAVLEVVGIPVGLGFALVTGYLLRRDRLMVGEGMPGVAAGPGAGLAPLRATRPRGLETGLRRLG